MILSLRALAGNRGVAALLQASDASLVDDDVEVMAPTTEVSPGIDSAGIVIPPTDSSPDGSTPPDAKAAPDSPAAPNARRGYRRQRGHHRAELEADAALEVEMELFQYLPNF